MREWMDVALKGLERMADVIEFDMEFSGKTKAGIIGVALCGVIAPAAWWRVKRFRRGKGDEKADAGPEEILNPEDFLDPD